MVSCGAINCVNSSSKYKIEQVQGWHGVPSNDKTLRKKWLAAMRRDPPYPKDKNLHMWTAPQ